MEKHEFKENAGVGLLGGIKHAYNILMSIYVYIKHTYVLMA